MKLQGEPCTKVGTDLVKEPPDFNGSVTKVRIALETIARRAASHRAAAASESLEKDSWGKALEYLRRSGILDTAEEEMMAHVYTFISPGAHVPVGVSEEEWTRLARTFGLSSCYFLLRKHMGIG